MPRGRSAARAARGTPGGALRALHLSPAACAVHRAHGALRGRALWTGARRATPSPPGGGVYWGGRGGWEGCGDLPGSGGASRRPPGKVTQRGGWPCPLPGTATPCACAWVPGAEDATSGLTGLSEQLVVTACKACQAYLWQREHEDVDVSEDAAEDLTEDEWKDLTEQHYALIQ